MTDYERLINHFFYHFNITITGKFKEHKNILSPHCYSVTYRLINASQSMSNGLIIRFSFDENDTTLKANVSCSYGNNVVDVLQFDGAILKDEIALGLKCMDFLDREQIRHYCPLIEMNVFMDKTTRKIVFDKFQHTLNIYMDRASSERLDLIIHVSKLLDKELKNLEIDTKNIDLNDKLDLLSMVRI